MLPDMAEESEKKKFDTERQHNSFQMSIFETSIFIYDRNVEIPQVLSGEQSVAL